MPLSLNIGDTVELKKQHACGCKEFEIIRVGMDIKIKCKNCGLIFYRQRLKKNFIRDYRCGKCKGKLEIIED